MSKTPDLVVNTGPILALIAGTGGLGLLRQLYGRVIIPHEVATEIEVNPARFGAKEFADASWLEKRATPASVTALLERALDRGEASVIQTALDSAVATVCIDEAVGRRMARLHGLRVTGSLGVLLRAKREGHVSALRPAIEAMRARGIWLSPRLVEGVLQMAGEAESPTNPLP